MLRQITGSFVSADTSSSTNMASSAHVYLQTQHELKTLIFAWEIPTTVPVWSAPLLTYWRRTCWEVGVRWSGPPACIIVLIACTWEAPALVNLFPPSSSVVLRSFAYIINSITSVNAGESGNTNFTENQCNATGLVWTARRWASAELKTWQSVNIEGERVCK